MEPVQTPFDLKERLAGFPRTALAFLPTPLHPLPRLSERLGGPEIWAKRDDLTGLGGGGNKTRKLEFVVGDAVAAGADTLVTVGAIQSNHARQTAAAAARVGMSCALLLRSWVARHDEFYEQAGNVLLSRLLGAEFHVDREPSHIGDDSGLDDLVDELARRGRRPYRIPGGASDHPLGGLGYVACALELVEQCEQLGVGFDAIVQCTGSGSTMAGLLAGLRILGSDTEVIGIADDGDRERAVELVHRLANATLRLLGADEPLPRSRIEIWPDFAPDGYGVPGDHTYEAIRLAAETEGVLVDPVYEGTSMAGLIGLVRNGRLGAGSRVLYLHMGGGPALHAYAPDMWTR